MRPYIYENGEVSHIRYGLFSSEYNGCGWIAAYNALNYLGISVPKENVAAEMSKTLSLGGLLGTSVKSVVTYLSQKGLYPQTHTDVQNFDKKIQSSLCGILYFQRGGSLQRHFTFLNKVDINKCRYINPTCAAVPTKTFIADRDAKNCVLITI